MTVPAEASLLNPVELFMAADWVVKGVMVGLALASLWSWAVIIDKAFRFTSMNRRADQFEDAIQAGQKVLIVDDLLATGGTVKGTMELVERLKGEVVGLAFLVELEFLKGRDRLEGRRVTSVIKY